MPFLSIIIATYNSGDTLRKALESVLTQSFQDWECVIVDGASKDNTLQIVKEFEKMDSRFRHISEPDNGVYDALNKGWRTARGEWVHYLGDDDRLTINGIKKLFDEPDMDKAEVVSGHCYMEKIDGTIKENYSHGFYGCHQGKITRRSTLERFDGFDLHFPVLADKDLMLRMENSGVSIINVDTFVAYFAMNGMSQNIKGLMSRARELYNVNKKNQISHPLWKTVRYAVMTFTAINYREIRKYLRKSLCYAIL